MMTMMMMVIVARVEQVVHLAVMMEGYGVMVVMFMAMINHDCYVYLPVHMMLLMMMIMVMMMMPTCPHAAADDDGDDVNLSTRRSRKVGKRSAEASVSENEAERRAKDEEVRNLNVIWHNWSFWKWPKGLFQHCVLF